MDLGEVFLEDEVLGEAFCGDFPGVKDKRFFTESAGGDASKEVVLPLLTFDDPVFGGDGLPLFPLL